MYAMGKDVPFPWHTSTGISDESSFFEGRLDLDMGSGHGLGSPTQNAMKSP
ncbi:MAG: hypothetical protein OJF50_005524 [Nitrospira sp.]|jgi:hypothetical protein|nr:hypothetical protein [Nitrospira sp.]